MEDAGSDQALDLFRVCMGRRQRVGPALMESQSRRPDGCIKLPHRDLLVYGSR